MKAVLARELFLTWLMEGRRHSQSAERADAATSGHCTQGGCVLPRHHPHREAWVLVSAGSSELGGWLLCNRPSARVRPRPPLGKTQHELGPLPLRLQAGHAPCALASGGLPRLGRQRLHLQVLRGGRLKTCPCALSLQPCMHTFCAACYSGWMERSAFCPTCRCPVERICKNHILNNLVEAYLLQHPGKWGARPAPRDGGVSLQGPLGQQSHVL